MQRLYTPCLTMIILFSVLMTSCRGDHEKKTSLIFATSGDYPPFEYILNGKLTGFDIELTQLIAQELNERIDFQDMTFSTIMPALQAGHVDGAIATIAITQERTKHFTFSDPYHFDSIAILFPSKSPIGRKEELRGKTIGCQLGTTVESWLRNNVDGTIVAMDSVNQAVAALQSGHVDCVAVDTPQARSFSSKNSKLYYQEVGQATEGYGLLFPQGSPLKLRVDRALRQLQERGEINALVQKWLDGTP